MRTALRRRIDHDGLQLLMRGCSNGRPPRVRRESSLAVEADAPTSTGKNSEAWVGTATRHQRGGPVGCPTHGTNRHRARPLRWGRETHPGGLRRVPWGVLRRWPRPWRRRRCRVRRLRKMMLGRPSPRRLVHTRPSALTQESLESTPRSHSRAHTKQPQARRGQWLGCVPDRGTREGAPATDW
jgi:hypothetical protein